eukprot:750335-Hanusia_phi.AAC.1
MCKVVWHRLSCGVWENDEIRDCEELEAASKATGSFTVEEERQGCKVVMGPRESRGMKPRLGFSSPLPSPPGSFHHE